MRAKLVLVTLLVVLLLVAYQAQQRVRGFRQAETVCQAVEAEDWERVLRQSDGFEGKPTQERRVAGCRCVAQIRTGQAGACAETLHTLRQRTAHEDWIPPPHLTLLLLDWMHRQGQLSSAAELSRRAASAYPDSAPLGQAEIELRSLVEDEDLVLRDITRRLDRSSPPEVRVHLANRRTDRHEWDEVLALTDQLPDEPTLRATARHLRGEALAKTNRMEELQELYHMLGEPSEAPAEDLARYAGLLGHNNLRDPRTKNIDLLRLAVDRADEFEDRVFLEATISLLLQALATVGDAEEIEETYARAKAILGHEVDRFTDDDIQRIAAARSLDQDQALEVATLELHPRGWQEGDTLHLAPDPAAGTDAPFVVRPVDSDRVRIQRTPDDHPFRWVWRSADGGLCGSGNLWPLSGRSQTVPLVRADFCPQPETLAVSQPAADGRIRIVAVLLDSAEWRIVRLLQARGDLPLFDHLEAEGVVGPIESRPPFTAAALELILHPENRGQASIASLMHSLGREIEGLNFVGTNPLRGLEWFLPERTSSLERLAEHRRIASVLRSFGSLADGRQAEILGPGGQRELLRGFGSSRPLTPAEAAAFGPGIETADGDLVAEMAADFDTIENLVARSDLDLVLFRVASFDIITHSTLLQANRPDQPHDTDFLLSTYRYADRRLGAIFRQLDADDVLIVFSDHGAKTALEHHPSALFFAGGGNVPHQPLEGQPHILGLTRLFADLWQLDSDLPATGLERWVQHEP